MFAHASEWERASGVCRNFTEQQHDIQASYLNPMNLSSILVRTRKIPRNKNSPAEKFPGRKIPRQKKYSSSEEVDDDMTPMICLFTLWQVYFKPRGVDVSETSLMTSLERTSEEKPALCYVIENNKRTSCSASQYHSPMRFFKTWKNGAIGWGYLRQICSVWVRVKRRVLSGMRTFRISSMKNDRSTPLIETASCELF